jgi:beta-catenin-like protein 1
LDEIEMLENAFDILCISLAESSNLDEFVRLEGLELMNLFVIERRRSKMKAFKVLDHALVTSATCTRYIEISGLSGLFTSFMLKGSKKYKKAYPDYSVKEEQEHIVSIIFSILKHVDDQDLIQRLLAKFVENEYEKLVRLLDIFDEYQKKTLEAEAQLAEASKGEKRDPDLVYLDRLDAGLFTLQLAALVLLDLAHVKQVFLLMQVRSQLEEQLAARNYDLETLTLIAQGSIANQNTTRT